MEFRGIDISKWQGLINWNEVKKDGTEFAILREGWGKKSPTQIDKRFKENYESAKAVGIPIGSYHYSYADSVDDAKREAEFCLENIQGMRFEYPVCFDIEDRTMLSLSNRQRTDIVKAFCSEIEKAGYYAMFYCNLNWLNNYLYKDELLPKYDLWLAQWNIDKPSCTCGIWQYSSTGKIDGIDGNVDLDVSYKNYPEIMKSKGLNGFSKSNNLENKNFFNYTVKKGDTLWAIAQRYLGSGYKYKEIKSLNALNSDMIYPGQTLKIPK
ncbi:MAG: LysM peptidoglycan-binding domain-containing protein [Clostridia bacterium]|nr:LysM peptidoglycan-binding domain-containing protein [Clostridia bacterium]